MPVARSLAQLQAQMMDKLAIAMKQVEQQSLRRMDDAVLYFYSGGTPVMYERTGHLMDTPKVDPVSRGGLSVQFRAYLNDQVGGYSTGVRPSMATVLWLTNNGNAGLKLRAAVGSRNWWKKAEQNIEKDFESAMRKYCR